MTEITFQIHQDNSSIIVTEKGTMQDLAVILMHCFEAIKETDNLTSEQLLSKMAELSDSEGGNDAT